MAKYINADRLLGSIKKSANECRNWKAEAIDDEIKARADAGLAAFIECALRVERQPTADVEEVRHGEWIWSGMGKENPPYCSECKREAKWCEDYGFIVEDYCPFCGAKMDGKKGEKND